MSETYKCNLYTDLCELFFDMKMTAQGIILPCDDSLNLSFDWVSDENHNFYSIKIKDANKCLNIDSMFSSLEKEELRRYFAKPRIYENTCKILQLPIFNRMANLKCFI